MWQVKSYKTCKSTIKRCAQSIENTKGCLQDIRISVCSLEWLLATNKHLHIPYHTQQPLLSVKYPML